MAQTDIVALKAFEDELWNIVNGNSDGLQHDGHFFDAAHALIADPFTPKNTADLLREAVEKMRVAYDALETVADMIYTIREELAEETHEQAA